MQPETRFKMKVARDLKTLPNTWFIKIQQKALRGIHDYILCVNGFFISLELKVPPNKIKAGSLQELMLKQVLAAGGDAFEVTPRNWPDVLEYLKTLSTGGTNGSTKADREGNGDDVDAARGGRSADQYRTGNRGDGYYC